MGLPIFSESSNDDSRPAPKLDSTAPARSAIRRQSTVRPHRRNGLPHDTERLEHYLETESQRPSVAWNSQLSGGNNDGVSLNQTRRRTRDTVATRVRREALRQTARVSRGDNSSDRDAPASDDAADPSPDAGGLASPEPPSPGQAGQRSTFHRQPTVGEDGHIVWDFDQFNRFLDDRSDFEAAQATIDRLNARGLVDRRDFESTQARMRRLNAADRARQLQESAALRDHQPLPGVLNGGGGDAQVSTSLWETDMMSNPISHRHSLRLPTPPRPASRHGAPIISRPEGDDRPGSRSDAELDDMPRLRRMGHRRIQDDVPMPPRRGRRGERAPDIDGLGDRERSLSADSDNDHDHWETLLTTIAPDPSLPSASSSFASSGPFSNDNANNSTDQTSNSSADQSQQQSPPWRILPSPPDLYSYSMPAPPPLSILPTPPPPPPAPEPPTADACDLETSPNTSDVDNARTTAQSRPSTARNHVRLINRRTRALRRQVDAFAEYYRSFNESFDRGEHSEVEARAALEEMGVILQRVSRRDDIPDEWFSRVGLSRSDVTPAASERRSRVGRRTRRRSITTTETRPNRERL